jgi:peptidoglycan/LPS O-acetylase OafA/YrhL
MTGKKWLRYTLGSILGGCTALSLTALVLPSFLASTGLHEELLIRAEIGGYTVYCVLAFAIGGWLIARVGIPKRGALILGGIGLLCGVVMALVVYPGEMDRLLPMAAAAAAYGAVVGLLLGHVLQKPRESDANS